MSQHKCYEDNQGFCYNGCGRIMNSDSARAYLGEAGYTLALEHRVDQLERQLVNVKTLKHIKTCKELNA